MQLLPLLTIADAVHAARLPLLLPLLLLNQWGVCPPLQSAAAVV
jgi:hypothetical protein